MNVEKYAYSSRCNLSILFVSSSRENEKKDGTWKV